MPKKCKCGCGQPTAQIKWADKSRGEEAGAFRDYIRGHYKRPRVSTDAERLAKHTLRQGSCLLWIGATDKDGYGIFSPYKQKTRRINRYVWELVHGEIPAGAFVCHTCDVPGCIEPSHLFLGTNDENMQDMVQKRRGTNGVAHPKTLLTEEAVRYIRSTAGLYKELKKQFGITSGTISNIRTRKTWKYLD